VSVEFALLEGFSFFAGGEIQAQPWEGGGKMGRALLIERKENTSAKILPDYLNQEKWPRG